MKAKCPHCQRGCDKCEDGYWEVSLPKSDMYLSICMNRAQCGFNTGGTFSDGRPDKMPPNCVMCGKPSEWVMAEEYEETEPPAWIENQKKFHIETLERHNDALRLKIKDLQALCVLMCLEKRLTVKEAQLLNVCRVCKGAYSRPFILNYGEEFAHKTCLPEGDK